MAGEVDVLGAADSEGFSGRPANARGAESLERSGAKVA